uniref:Pentacotripeptide-repeat region of PRORP domain-containing protein n=1 Tax=Oryza glumipatula TaxID=40148 RepID=A0A0E0AJW2_9ORYZ
MYARRRSVRDAVRLFDEMPERLLNETPTMLTEGLADEGKKLFTRMKEYSLEPNLKHYACMVDRLGRASSRGRRYGFYNANRT